MPAEEHAVVLRDATMGFGRRVLWSGLDLHVAAGEFVAILGPNGSGKSTLLKVLLGLVQLTNGTVRIAGHPATRGNSTLGYVPQQTSSDLGLSLRSRDLVGFGWDGHRFGVGLNGRRVRRQRVNDALAAVGAGSFADAPVGRLSGGEMQRLRVAQALVGDPSVLLCDEPLLSLDLAHQQSITRLIDQRRREATTAVLFVTHEINPILSMVDRVLYLVDGRFRIGTPSEVMTSEVLSDLYRTDVDVVTVGGRLIVVGGDESVPALPGHHVHHSHDAHQESRP
jgi:zinc/manganese transport system ATP-binding protein